MLSALVRSLSRRKQIAMPIHIPARKSGSLTRPIQTITPSPADGDELLVPLTFVVGLKPRPANERGQRVAAGAPLSLPEGPEVLTTFSPIAAVVEGFTTVDTPFSADLPAVRLRPLDTLVDAGAGTGAAGADGDLAGGGDGAHRALMEIGRIEDLPTTLDELGIVAGYDGRLVALGNLLRKAAARGVNLLVVNAIQGEPRLASCHRLAIDATATLAAGARAMAAYLSVRHATLLVGAAVSLPDDCIKILRRHHVRTMPVRTCFPGDAEPIALKRLFQRTVPVGGSGLDARCLMLGADAVWRVGAALLQRLPAVVQPITIAGDCLGNRHQGTYLVPVGTTVASLVRWLSRQQMLQEQPRTIILGGPMTGSSVADPSRTVIDQATQGLLLTHHRGRLQTTACIRCGWCVYGCPVGIDPIAILDAFESPDQTSLIGLAASRCIECNVCSYVCPSHLPLAQAVRTVMAVAQGPARI